MKTIVKRISQKQLKAFAETVAYEKDYILFLKDKSLSHGVFSKTDNSYLGEDISCLKEFLRLGITEQFQSRKARKKTLGLSFDSGNVAQLGFNPTEQKWYGWSHRAIHGFGIGYVVQKNSTVIISKKFPVGYKAKTLADCKELAKRFAQSVG